VVITACVYTRWGFHAQSREIDPSCEDHAVDELRCGLLWKQPEGGRKRLEWDLENVKFHRGSRSPRDRGWRAISSHGRCHPKEMLVLQVGDESVKRGITGEISMTLEDNFMINRFIEVLGASRHKTYRIYRKQLPC
jgi:hypothetical protein